MFISPPCRANAGAFIRSFHDRKNVCPTGTFYGCAGLTVYAINFDFYYLLRRGDVRVGLSSF